MVKLTFEGVLQTIFFYWSVQVHAHNICCVLLRIISPGRYAHALPLSSHTMHCGVTYSAIRNTKSIVPRAN